MPEVLDRFAERLGDASEALERQQRMTNDLQFLLEHMEDWRTEHPNRWVAVYNGQVVAFADTKEKILEAVEAKGVPLREVVLDFLGEARAAYLL